jgi:hypothetical protein
MMVRTVTLQRVVVVAVLALATAYFAVLRPLAERVREEQVPLAAVRERLARVTVEAGLPAGTGFLALEEHLGSLRGASRRFATAEREFLPRLEHPPEVQQRLEEPFQFVEFLNESQRRVEELGAMAQTSRVALTAGLARGFPRYQVELLRPELLWVQLATIHRVVRTAIRAGVREISEVSVEPLPAVEGFDGIGLPMPHVEASPTNQWSMLRVHLTASGSVNAMANLLLALGLTPQELEATQLSQDLGGRPALFIDNVLLRRTDLESPEQAQLELVVSTAVPNESP